MDGTLNLGISDIQSRLNAFADSEEDGPLEGGGHIRTGNVNEGGGGRGRWRDTRVLFFFSQLFDLMWGSVFLTTYVERGRNEYFAGFSNVNLFTPFLGDRLSSQYFWIHLSLVFRASTFAVSVDSLE